MMDRLDIHAWLELKLTAAQCRLHRELINQLRVKFAVFLKGKARSREYDSREIRMILCQFMTQWVRDEIARLDDLFQAYDDFVEQYAHAISVHEQERYVQSFAEKLGANARQLRGDQRAFARWFGIDAVSERFQRRSAERGRDIAFVLRRIGTLSAQLLSEVITRETVRALWQRLALEQNIAPLLSYTRFEPVRIAAFHCLVEPLHILPVEVREVGLSDATLRYVYRCALDREQDVWLQCEALNILTELSTKSFETVIRQRIANPGWGDELFVRRQMVRLVGEHIHEIEDLEGLLALLIADPSPAVRQSLMPALSKAPVGVLQDYLARLACEDEVAQVRAAATLACLELVMRQDCTEAILACLERVLKRETNDFVLRVALLVVANGYTELSNSGRVDAEAWYQRLLPLLQALRLKADSTVVRRFAAQTCESLWIRNDEKAWQLQQRLQTWVDSIPEGRTRRLPKDLVPYIDDERFGRVLAWLAQQDFGFDVTTGRRPKITRGHRFGFRTWRFLHELRNPSTDKRQAFRHTTGRIFHGQLRVPSGILAELAQTKVPGEPLLISKENDWRPYLPLVDELISALDLPLSEKKLVLYTSEGKTEIILPRSFRKRLAARVRLTRRFSEYAELRNWDEGSGQSASRYLSELRKLGFDFRLDTYAKGSIPVQENDGRVTHFFPAVLPFAEGDWFVRLKDYFFSLYENKLSELILFLAITGSWFIGRQMYLFYQIKRARRAIPLVIGGWGTRGKSGTERLKAALFNALGYNVVSKTTGCEAMFLHGYAHGKLREMFLFRPYDKATIWEQANVLRIGQKLNGEVFLWECMGLTPAFIEILQQQWMCDDISTITNTYPDHEDLQGPAGINIPQVMTRFIPSDSLLVTSEEQMLPILRESAKHKRTQLRSVGWLQAGLLAPDLLERFPYEEHPYNIALVMAMADELGIDGDFAIREMADRVVPDLGVLKVSPPAPIRARVLEFTNGMSANERFGCMANWERTGFNRQDPVSEPGVFLTTVVNNRADRVPRSKVFASMLVNDLMVDCHVLIGTNLDGLQGFIEDAWNEYSSELSLWHAVDDKHTGETPLQLFTEAAKRFRMLVSRESVEAELARLLQNLGVEMPAEMLKACLENPQKLLELEPGIIDAEILVEHVNRRLQALAEYDEFAVALRDSVEYVEKLDQRFKTLLKRWFDRKFILVDNAHAVGEEIIGTIIEASPPGIHNRIMGIQNIKGTGLDFVYRWQAWEQCHSACQELVDVDEQVSQRGLQSLVAFRDFGSLSEEHVNACIERVRHADHAQTERFQAELNVIDSNLGIAMRKVRDHQLSQRSMNWMSRLINGIESFIDAGDAISRRKLANRIYRDLANERISHAQAALELQALNKRQKGGWLLARIEHKLARIAARFKVK